MNEHGERGDTSERVDLPELYDYRAYTRKREEEGTVLSVEGDMARVHLRRSRYCEGCGSCCVVVDNDTMIAEAINHAGASKGDRVIVDIPLKTSIRAAYILYGVPLLAFLAGFGIGALLSALIFDGRFYVPLGLVFAFVFLALSYVLLSRIYGQRSRASSKYLLVVTRILHAGEI